jgi:hypothetical protein
MNFSNLPKEVSEEKRLGRVDIFSRFESKVKEGRTDAHQGTDYFAAYKGLVPDLKNYYYFCTKVQSIFDMTELIIKNDSE